MNHLKINNNKHVIYILLLTGISLQGFGQNNPTGFYNSINYNWAVPIAFIIGFAFFMLHAFMKQKDN